ncbi:hypothetical protein ANCCEY_02613 [Ancylostoma ceylanicum]|uniref:Solute-binding protein family 3/N-terminal domain-containing protein n=1 Tax=Ancylostoma ceylanicum TaxID=53326 RepID=A0A0D6M7C2_9BILA|nr:hypothetical protein ANCCEY_02613 [Ancylostoma ceylanicum]
MPGRYHLRAIGYKEYRPYVDFTSFCWNLDCPSPGSDLSFEVDFLNINLDLMNSTAEIVQLDLDIDDTIEMISNGSADISVQAVRQTLERMQKVDFATPTGYLYHGYFIKEVPQLEVVDYILSSFDFDAKLRSFFALSHKRGTIFTNFDGVLDAVQYKGWTMVIQERGYTPYLFCKPHQCERLNGLKNRILHLDRSKDMLDYVALDRHVGFGALPYDTDQYPIVVFERKRSVLFVTDVDIAPEYLAFALNKNIPGLRESFNRAIATSSDGLDNIRNRYAIPYEQYVENPREKEHIILKFAHMPFKYNLTAVGLRYDFPYVNLGHGCMTLDCPYPGAEVEFLRQSLRMANATATLVPREMNADEMIDMVLAFDQLGNGTADISIFALIQKKDRMEKVRFTTPIGFIYTGYFVREVAQIEVADYIMTSFRIPAKLRSVLTLTRYRGTIFTNLDEAMDAMEYHGWKMIIQRGEKEVEYNTHAYRFQPGSPNASSMSATGSGNKKARTASLNMVEERFADVDSLLSQDRMFVFSALAYDLAPHSKSLVDDRRRLLFIRDELITPKYLAFAVRNFETIRGRYQKPYDEYVDIQSLQQETSLSLAHFHVLLDVALKAYLVTFSVFVGVPDNTKGKMENHTHTKPYIDDRDDEHFCQDEEIIYYRHGQLLLDRINAACHKFFFTAPFPSKRSEESFELPSLDIASEECSHLGNGVRRRSRRSLIQELEVSLLIPVLATKDHHFVFSALPKDLAPHRKSLIDDYNRILFVRDELITPEYLAFAVRKGMPKLLEKLNQAIAIMSNSFATIRGRYQNPYEKYADKQFYKRQTALTMPHFQAWRWQGAQETGNDIALHNSSL